jgi:putative phosphoesterase
MIRIGVVSDTHHDWQTALKALQQLGRLDLICHAGDMYNDGEKLGKLLGIEVKVVVGNCDYRKSVPHEQVFQIGEKKIFLTHGHLYQVKRSYQNLVFRGMELAADIVIFGHTHIPVCFEQGKMLLINPGSLREARGGSKPSYALLEITEQKVEAIFFSYSP